MSSMSKTCLNGGKTILLNELRGLRLGDCRGVVRGVLEGEVMLNIGWWYAEDSGESGLDFFLGFSSMLVDCNMVERDTEEPVLGLEYELNLDAGISGLTLKEEDNVVVEEDLPRDSREPKELELFVLEEAKDLIRLLLLRGMVKEDEEDEDWRKLLDFCMCELLGEKGDGAEGEVENSAGMYSVGVCGIWKRMLGGIGTEFPCGKTRTGSCWFCCFDCSSKSAEAFSTEPCVAAGLLRRFETVIFDSGCC